MRIFLRTFTYRVNFFIFSSKVLDKVNVLHIIFADSQIRRFADSQIRRFADSPNLVQNHTTQFSFLKKAPLPLAVTFCPTSRAGDFLYVFQNGGIFL